MARQQSFRWAAALAVLALVVAACGSSSSTPAPAATAGPATPVAATAGDQGGGNQAGGTQSGGGGAADLCSALTDAQITAAMDGSLGAGTPQNDGQMCLWQDQTNGQASLSIEDRSISDICGPVDASIVKVEGVGDQACYLVGGTLGTSLNFAKVAVVYSVAVVIPNGTLEAVEVAEKTLALDALARL